MKRIVCMIMATIITISSTMITDAEGINYKTCNGFRYNVDGKEINYYVGKKTTATIPAKIEGEKVRDVFLYKAPNLKKLKVSRYVKTIVVARNKKLKKVTIDKRNKYITVSNNCILNKKKTKLLSVLGGYKEIRVPETVKVIDGTPFLGSNVSKIIITKNVKKVTFGAFSKCFKVKEIVFEGDKLPPNMEGWPSRNWGSKLENSMKFYVKNETLADKLLEKIDGKSDLYAKVYVGDKLVREKQLNYNLNY